MNDILAFLGVIAVYLVLIKVVLPKLGIQG